MFEDSMAEGHSGCGSFLQRLGADPADIVTVTPTSGSAVLFHHTSVDETRLRIKLFRRFMEERIADLSQRDGARFRRFLQTVDPYKGILQLVSWAELLRWEADFLIIQSRCRIEEVPFHRSTKGLRELTQFFVAEIGEVRQRCVNGTAEREMQRRERLRWRFDPVVAYWHDRLIASVREGFVRPRAFHAFLTAEPIELVQRFAALSTEDHLEDELRADFERRLRILYARRDPVLEGRSLDETLRIPVSPRLFLEEVAWWLVATHSPASSDAFRVMNDAFEGRRVSQPQVVEAP